MKNFISPTYGRISLSDIAKEIVEYVKSEPEEKYQLIIGTDSEGNGKIEFATAIVIYRKGKGGRYFYHKFSKEKNLVLRQKIYEEVTASLQTGLSLIENLKPYWKAENLNGQMEIHIDVGENGPTKELIKEVVGMVLGYGFQAKIKPHSYGASIVADKYL